MNFISVEKPGWIVVLRTLVTHFGAGVSLSHNFPIYTRVHMPLQYLSPDINANGHGAWHRDVTAEQCALIASRITAPILVTRLCENEF